MEIQTQAQLDAAIAATPGEKVTPHYMRSRISSHSFHRLDGTLIVCVITLDNGYTVTGQSACADPVNFSEAIGQKIAFDNAFNALWPLFGFLLSERRHQSYLSGATSAVEMLASFDFGVAIELLRQGKRVARAGWNGKGMWLLIIPECHWETTRNLENLDGLPWIGMKTADDKFVPWLASQTDMLATDWQVV